VTRIKKNVRKRWVGKRYQQYATEYTRLTYQSPGLKFNNLAVYLKSEYLEAKQKLMNLVLLFWGVRIGIY